MAWTVSTIKNRVALTGNTRERTNNNGGLNSSTIDNRVAQTVNTVKKLRTWWLEQLAPWKILGGSKSYHPQKRKKAKNMVPWTDSTIENRVTQTVNTHERTKNNGGLNSSTIDNRVAQTVNTHEKAKNMVAWTVSTIENTGWLKQLTPAKTLRTWWLEQLAP